MKFSLVDMQAPAAVAITGAALWSLVATAYISDEYRRWRARRQLNCVLRW